jgi:hypothetical protein
VKLTEWVPQLAKEVTGSKYSPNWDFIIHLDAQRLAPSFGISWTGDMPKEDIDILSGAVRAKYGKK